MFSLPSSYPTQNGISQTRQRYRTCRFWYLYTWARSYGRGMDPFRDIFSQQLEVVRVSDPPFPLRCEPFIAVLLVWPCEAAQD